MNTVLWVLQGVMAFVALPGGLMTALRRGRSAELHGRAVRIDDGPGPAGRLGGLLAAACGAALVVPGLVGRAVELTPIAALALLVPAVAVPARRLTRGEIGGGHWFFGTLHLAAAPVLVAWGRLGHWPLQHR